MSKVNNTLNHFIKNVVASIFVVIIMAGCCFLVWNILSYYCDGINLVEKTVLYNKAKPKIEKLISDQIPGWYVGDISWSSIKRHGDKYYSVDVDIYNDTTYEYDYDWFMIINKDGDVMRYDFNWDADSHYIRSQ